MKGRNSMEIKEMIQTIHEEKQSIGGIQQVIWLAAGGSYGGFYPGHYFLDQEYPALLLSTFNINLKITYNYPLSYM